MLNGITRVHPEREYFHLAGVLGGPHLRTLDALQVVTAIKAEAQFFIAYDRRLLDAAAASGFNTVTPT